MPTSTDKPYRVYRQPRRTRGDGSIEWEDFDTSRSKHQKRAQRTKKTGRKRFFKYVRRAAYAILTLSVIWGGVIYYAFSKAVHDSNSRLDPKVQGVLAPTSGPAMVTAQYTLMIGTDTRGEVGDLGRSDSLIIVRTDPRSRHYSMLSIPRDQYVNVPGYGMHKINSAYALGGAPLAIQTVRRFTNLRINHAVVINFQGFKQVIDNLGGIEVYNPKEIRSNRFDGRVWRFPKGNIHLTGRRALAYSRVRSNQLDPTESDLTRGARQQAVFDAINEKIVSTYSIIHPFNASKAIMSPIKTDASTEELLAFAAAKKLAGFDGTLRCRLGGTSEFQNRENVLMGDEENKEAIRAFMFAGPAIRPDTAVNQFAPGCLRPGQVIR